MTDDPSTTSPGAPPPSSRSLRPDTLAVSLGRPAHEPGAGVNVPIELSSTYRAGGPVGYAREDNPAWAAFEEVVAALEGGEHGVAFPAGSAAINAMLALTPVGATVVAPTHPYAGTRGRLQQWVDSGRITVRWVDASDAAAVAAAMDGADLALLESPTNPLMEICDLRAAAAAARTHGVRTVVDNTFATPLGQRPLDLGIDVVVHSGTKYLSGHSDVLIGVAVCSDDDLVAALRLERGLSGSIVGPFEAFLALRGLRTLSVRMDRATANAAVLAGRLVDHPAVDQVRYPGLASDPGHAVAAAQMSAFGAVIGILVAGDARTTEAVSETTRLWTHATSLGGVESLIERRARWTFENPDIPANHLRLSVGIENVEDLWDDLDRALREATGTVR